MIIKLFKKHWAMIVLVLATIAVAFGFGLCWNGASSWWVHSLLVLGAAVCEYLIAFGLAVYFDIKRSNQNIMGYWEELIDEMDQTLICYLLCCVGLTIVLCFIASSILWCIIIVLLMLVALVFGVVIFVSEALLIFSL